MLQSIDQMGNKVTLEAPPMRIVSLVPSQTELLFDLGLDDRVVGVTKFCVHPIHWRKSKTVIGGTKKFDLDLIDSLQPDLIIGNKEENYEEGIQALRERYPLWMSDIVTFDHALDMIRLVGQLTGQAGRAESMIHDITGNFMSLRPFPSIRTLYLMWRKPWMGAAGNTFIDAVMEKTGLINVLANETRYPQLSTEEIARLNPSLVLLSSEPYPFSEQHIPELRTALPDARFELVDGEYFSWYGSRLLLAPLYLNQLQL